MTVLVMGVALLLGVVLNYLAPENLFLILAAVVTFSIVWVWLMILLSQVAMRRGMSREEIAALDFRCRCGPSGRPWRSCSCCSSSACWAGSRIRAPRCMSAWAGWPCCRSATGCGWRASHARRRSTPESDGKQLAGPAQECLGRRGGAHGARLRQYHRLRTDGFTQRPARQWPAIVALVARRPCA